MEKRTKKRVILFAAIVAVLILSAIAIVSQPQYVGKENYQFFPYEDPAKCTQFLNVTVNDFTLSVDTFADGAVYDTAWMTTEYDTGITVGDYSGYRVFINSQEVEPGGSISLRVERLSKNDFIDIQIYSESGLLMRTVKIRTLNSSFPDFNTYNVSDDDAYLCYSIPNYNMIAKSDRNGNVLFYRLGTSASCFRQYNVDGKIRYSFMEQTGASFSDSPEDKCYKAIMLNEKYEVIDIISSVTSSDGSVVDGLCRDGFYYIDDSHYVVASHYCAYMDKVTNGRYRSAYTLIQEVADGSAIWSNAYCTEEELNALKLTFVRADEIEISETADSITSESSDNSSGSEYQYVFTDALGLSEIKHLPDSGYTFCLFSNAGIVSRISGKNGEKIESVRMPDDVKLRSFDIISEEEILCMYSDKDGKTYAERLTFGGSVFGNEIYLCQYSSGDGSICLSESGCFIVGWDNNQAQSVEFTEFNSDGSRVLLEITTSEGTDCVIDSVSYADRRVGAA